MKKTLFALALAVAAFASTSVAAAAPVAGTCSTSDMPGSVACVGGFSGNEIGTPARVTATGTKFTDLAIAEGLGFAGDLPFTLLDSSDNTAGSQISLIFETGGKTGQVILKDPTNVLNFNIFGISLKAGNFNSLYLFDGAALSAFEVMENLAPGFTTLDFNTIGTGKNGPNGTALGLSHASLWLGGPSNFGDSCGIGNGESCPAIPEPSTYALMIAGLGAMAFVTRRRKTQK